MLVMHCGAARAIYGPCPGPLLQGKNCTAAAVQAVKAESCVWQQTHFGYTLPRDRCTRRDKG
jgi:hypothetical protein